MTGGKNMFCKNLRYYRLRSSMTKKRLAEQCGLSSMAITQYENGKRYPENMKIIHSLADALGVRVSDFLRSRGANMIFSHGEFRKNSILSHRMQEYIRESVEEYFGRFFTVVEILGGDVIPEPPKIHSLRLTKDIESDAIEMRRLLKISEEGPLPNLVEMLENKGVLFYLHDAGSSDFSAMNGTVNDYPYIVLNLSMTAERNRSNTAHELVHMLFDWPSGMAEDECEKLATAIGGAFLFPKVDIIRELGIRRKSITKDMDLVCKEYGVSMLLLAKRAEVCGVITKTASRDFFVRASQAGWRKNEPSRIDNEVPSLFVQLVYRAVSEGEISIQKGAELLQTSYEEVQRQCFFENETLQGCQK